MKSLGAARKTRHEVPVETVWYNDPIEPQWIEARFVDGWLIETGRTLPRDEALPTPSQAAGETG